jgi:hypothetical protein
MCTNSLNLKPFFSNPHADPDESPYKDPSIYVICREAWQNGSLHGVWINALQSPEGIMIEIDAMLSNSPVLAKGWEIYKLFQFGDYNLEKKEDLHSVCEKAQRAHTQNQRTGTVGLKTLPRYAEKPWHPSDENYSDVEHEDPFESRYWEHDEEEE